MATPERELAPEAPIAPTPAARSGLPPGPATWPPLQMLRYARRPYGSIEENARQFGSCWTARAPGQPPIVSFSAPDAIKVIFTADVDEVHGGEGQAPILGPILGWKSVLVLDGARHRRERRLLMPPFHGERMHLYGLMMREITTASSTAGRSASPSRSIARCRRSRSTSSCARSSGSTRAPSSPACATRCSAP